MEDSNNKRQRGFLSNALGVAKKLSDVGLDMLQQATTSDAKTQNIAVSQKNIIEGTARTKGLFEPNQYDNPQHLLRNHLPQVSQNLFGRHYSSVNRVANLVAPDLSDKLTDFFYDKLNSFTDQISSVDAVLDEAGIQDLEALTQDVDRSHRISQALAEQNKWIASVQGALFGATGTLGTAVDIPASIVMSLRTIYQIGRSYGFDLNKDEQDIVQYIFKQVDLGLIAEKQAILMGLKAISQTLQSHDVYQLQKLLGSSNDIELLRKWLSAENGEMKWQWLNNFSQVSKTAKLVPLVSASVGAVYSWRLVEDVHHKAQTIFSQARHYLIHHQEVKLSPMLAYEKSLEWLQTTPKLIEHALSQVTDSTELLETNTLKDTEKKENRVDGHVTTSNVIDPIEPPQAHEKSTSVKPRSNVDKKSEQVSETGGEIRKTSTKKRVTKKTDLVDKE